MLQRVIEINLSKTFYSASFLLFIYFLFLFCLPYNVGILFVVPYCWLDGVVWPDIVYHLPHIYIHLRRRVLCLATSVDIKVGRHLRFSNALSCISKGVYIYLYLDAGYLFTSVWLFRCFFFPFWKHENCVFLLLLLFCFCYL